MCYYLNLYRKIKWKKARRFTVTWTDVHDRDDDRVYYTYCLPYMNRYANKVRSLQQVEVPTFTVAPFRMGGPGSVAVTGLPRRTPPPYVGTCLQPKKP